MLELVKVHQRAFEFVEIHFLDFGAARNPTDEPWHAAMAVGATFVRQAAVNVIPGTVTQDDRAARVKRSENDFAGLAGRHNFAGTGIDDFK